MSGAPPSSSAPAGPSPAATLSRTTIDAGLLYWAMLPPEQRPLTRQQQVFRFERFVPIPIEQLHVVGHGLPDGRVLMVGIATDRLRAHLAERPEVSDDTWVLTPDRIPDHYQVDDPGAVLAGLNLLQGGFEPLPRRRARRWRDRAVAIALAVALVLALVGIERRVATANQAVVELQERGRRLLAERLGPQTGSLPHAAAQLTQELRRLEQAARGPLATQSDIPGLVQQLWQAWPADVRAQVDTLSVAADRLVVRGSVPTLADAERLATASSTLTAGDAVYRAAPLQAEQTRQGAAFLITWHLAQGGLP